MQSASLDYWGVSKKAAFRFFFVFFLFTLFPFPFTQFTFLDFPLSGYEKLWDAITLWVGSNVLHLNYEFSSEPNGSGDRTFDYVFLLTTVSVAFVVCIGWSFADRRRNNYTTLYQWLSVYVRFYLAVAMFEYGFAKIFLTQFPPFTSNQLLQTYGHSSPMNLLWTFMSYSSGNNFFIGVAEILAGIFLLFRRTTVLGALIAIAIMSNVAALNFFYDVPVKIFSVELLLLAAFLLLKDANRLIRFFVLNKPVEAATVEPYFTNQKMKYTQWSIKFLFIGYVLYSNITDAYATQKKYAKRPFLYGIYYVETFVINNDTLPPLTTDTVRWSKLIIENNDFASLRIMNERKEYLSFETDTLSKIISVFSYADTTQKSLLYFNLPDSNHLVLNGKFKKDSIVVTMKKVDLNKFPLVSRGFHWVNEYPVNY